LSNYSEQQSDAITAIGSFMLLLTENFHQVSVSDEVFWLLQD